MACALNDPCGCHPLYSWSQLSQGYDVYRSGCIHLLESFCFEQAGLFLFYVGYVSHRLCIQQYLRYPWFESSQEVPRYDHCKTLYRVREWPTNTSHSIAGQYYCPIAGKELKHTCNDGTVPPQQL